MSLEDVNLEGVVKVTTKKNGFRRSGVVWHGESLVPADAFTKKQWIAIANEPMLIVSMPSDAEAEAWFEQQEKAEAEKTAATKDVERPEDEAEAKQQIIDVVNGLDKEDKTHWVGKGDKLKPDATVLSEKLGWKVSAKERDAVWAELNKD